MFKTTLLSVLLLALAMHSVNGKPACGCASSKAPPPTPSTLPPCHPTTPEPCVAKQEITTTTSTTSNPCVTTAAPKVPCIEQTTPSPTTTTTTTTTQAPTTTTTVAPSTSTAAPKTDCTNGDIYPVSVGGCNQFLMCRNRVYILMVCPLGLGFNFQTKSCERSANVPACSART